MNKILKELQEAFDKRVEQDHLESLESARRRKEYRDKLKRANKLGFYLLEKVESMRAAGRDPDFSKLTWPEILAECPELPELLKENNDEHKS